MRRLLLVTIAASLSVPAMSQTTGPSAIAPQAPPTVIVYSNKGPNGASDLPLGVHHVPDSNVIISGHQRGGALGMLLGPLGMLVQSSANAEGGTGKVQNVQDALRFDVTAEAAELTGTILADHQNPEPFTLTPRAGSSTLTVVPYVVITFENETDVRPYVVLKTRLSTDGSSDSGKALKYFCCEGKAIPLTGDNGIAGNGGARLKAILTSELEVVIRVMLMDRSNHYTQDGQKISVNGYLPFVGKPVKFKGYDLGRYAEYRLIKFPSGALVFGGVNIAELDSLDIAPLDK
jgi:hypothetical protein